MHVITSVFSLFTRKRKETKQPTNNRKYTKNKHPPPPPPHTHTHNKATNNPFPSLPPPTTNQKNIKETNTYHKKSNIITPIPKSTEQNDTSKTKPNKTEQKQTSQPKSDIKVMWKADPSSNPAQASATRTRS